MAAHAHRPYPAPHVLVEGHRHPLLLSTGAAAAWLGMTEHSLREKAGTAELPLTPVRLGRLYRWSTIEVARLVGLDPEVVTEPVEPAA